MTNDYSAIAELLKTPESFYTWVVTQPEQEELGRTRDALHCPIALFLQSVTQRTYVVGAIPGTIWESKSDNLFDSPFWVQLFIRRIDQEDVVTRELCLHVLDEL